MHDQVFNPPVPVPSGFLQLTRVWEVRGDASYQIPCPRGFPSDGWILLRTLAGRGFVELTGGHRLDCASETLVLLDPRQISRYGCVRPQWVFWWFECGQGSVWPLQTGVVLKVAAGPGERRRLELCARRLHAGVAAAGMASAMLLLLCHEWHAGYRMVESAARARWASMEQVMRQMQATAQRPMAVGELARLASLSEGRFRRVFRQTAGCAPKAYYENLRLARAVVWLQSGQMKLAEIAQRLNYSSAFHFSRAFKKRYGVPPSAYRVGPRAGQ
jgi:AraC-like DNA-binding protein